MFEPLVVLSSCSGPEEGARLARLLVGERVAACVSLVPGAQSIYLWQGKMEEAGECLLLIKTSRPCLNRLQELLAGHHSYDVPEVLAIPVADGSPAYLRWLEESLAQTSEDNPVL
ncbi:MAG: divalent-cation tolerance protein CutA [Bryobacterales bacterium]|nr:divalent-cation tolerance protein CutA [Bryobacterales bacterium]